jgi:2-polyprenyl-3-methyl-5-hydroxy-6-metoxy-1,4-benzoquinol methylase
MHEDRFAFGKNWLNFLETVSSENVKNAEENLVERLGLDTLAGRRFLDIGCGSGLFSLAARRLGAIVRSFDYDRESVSCAEELKRRYLPGDDGWTIDQGSALDEKYLESLGTFDVVYSWGVLHHTGDMQSAIELAAMRVQPGGLFLLSIYNDQGVISKRWEKIKRFYVSSPDWQRKIILGMSFLGIWGWQLTRDLLKGRGFSTLRNYGKERGMSYWYDLVDWVGGYPFEVACPERILVIIRPLGFSLEKLKTCAGGRGCNEYLFRKVSDRGI